MSLNKFTEFVPKKNWMQIGCRILNADEIVSLEGQIENLQTDTLQSDIQFIRSYKDYNQIGTQVATLDPNLVTYDLKTVFENGSLPLRYFLTVRGSKNKAILAPGTGFVDSYQLPSTITDRFGVKTALYQITACNVIDYGSSQMFPSNITFGGTNNTLINIIGGFPATANAGVDAISTFDFTVELEPL